MFNEYNISMAKVEYNNRIIDSREVFRITEIGDNQYEVELKSYEILVVDKETASKLLGGAFD